MPTPHRLAGRLLLPALLALAGGCSSPKPRNLEPIGELEVRFVEPLAAPGPETLVLDYRGVRIELGPAHRFGLAEVGLATDATGGPALLFELREADKPAFRALTATHKGRSMGMVVDGQLVTLAVVQDELPGRGLIEGDFDLADIEAMLLALTEPRRDD
jgi:hypothetical protein